MRKRLLLVLFSLFAVTFAFAQVTTSSLTGSIKDSRETLIGATVKATYQPSGTVYATSTRADGRYTIPNMRAGGPYLIEVSYIGYENQTFNNITLKLGESFVLNVTLQQTGTALKEVTIAATNPQSVLNSDRSGSVTNLSTRDINNLPSVTRNINDLTRLTPQASSNGQSIGGGNYRQNNITVDGGNFNNQFGIGTNLPGNGNPIPLDALDEISVSVNPVDVRQSGFIGSAINATTRSGTNQVSGSIYSYFRGANQVGTRVRSYPELIPAAQDVRIYGARVGGPIIKNKLFLFVNFEHAEQPGETGPYQNYGYKSERTNAVARIDWNINDKNRFNVRYSLLQSKTPSFLSTSTNPLTGTVYPGGGTRGDNNALAYSNSNYFTNYNFYSLSAELNSTVFTRFANTLRFTYNNQNEPRSSNSSLFPFVDILKDGRPFTYGNLRDVQSYSFVDYLQWTLERHNLLAGIQADLSTTKNGFQRFGTSYYIFNSFDDFRNGANPAAYAKTFSLNADYSQAFPTFKNQTYSVYAQDDYNVNDKLRLTFGLRANLYQYSQNTPTHPLIAALTFANGEKLNTGVLPKSALLVSPRFGFNYDLKGDRSIQFRGSAGIFSGGIPNVWIVSQVGDAGMIQFSQVAQTAASVAAVA
ncbi:MAG: TonB-dependent receptor, partial [Sphingobacteriaceae bacterium]